MKDEKTKKSKIGIKDYCQFSALRTDSGWVGSRKIRLQGLLSAVFAFQQQIKNLCNNANGPQHLTITEARLAQLVACRCCPKDLSSKPQPGQISMSIFS